MQGDFNCCLLFYIVSRFIGLVFLFFLRGLSRSLNRDLTGSFRMESLKGLQRLRFLGMSCISLRRKEAWG
jgi:hypothetical protein